MRETVEAPAAIYQTARHPTRRAFHRTYDFGGQIGDQHVRVIVEYMRRRPRGVIGIILTAFAATGPKQGEVRVWPS